VKIPKYIFCRGF